MPADRSDRVVASQPAQLTLPDQVVMNDYCKKYVGLRLVVEGLNESECDSWSQVSQHANCCKKSKDKFTFCKQWIIAERDRHNFKSQ